MLWMISWKPALRMKIERIMEEPCVATDGKVADLAYDLLIVLEFDW